MNRNSTEQQNNPEPRKENRGVMIRQETSFSGPLPSPETLKKFDEVIPGAAERIIKMAEGQFEHRTELERKVINSDIERSKWGQILGFVIAIVGLVCAVIISIYGSQIGGAALGLGTLASLVGVFMYGSRSRTKEREAKENVSAN